MTQRWTSAAIERTRESVRSVLEKKAAKQSRGQALRFAATQVLLLDQDATPLQQLLRFCYALSALEWHAEHGGLSDKNAQVLTEHAQAILTAQGVAPERSKLGRAVADLDICLARIAARDGRHWEAAALASLSLTATMRAAAGRGRTLLTWGERALRLGDASTAVDALERAGDEGLGEADGRLRDQLLLSALRLAGRLGELQRVHDALSPAARARPEVQWEILVAACSSAGDFRPLAVAVHKGKAHYEPRTICLATLYALSEDRLIDRGLCPKLETIVRRRDLAWPFQAPVVGLARAVDAAEPLDGFLAAPHRLATAEEELLLWACAARHFARAQDFRLASLALRRYRALSWSLSDGAQTDALGLVGSLMQRSWFQQSSADAASTTQEGAG